MRKLKIVRILLNVLLIILLLILLTPVREQKSYQVYDASIEYKAVFYDVLHYRKYGELPRDPASSGGWRIEILGIKVFDSYSRD